MLNTTWRRLAGGLAEYRFRTLRVLVRKPVVHRSPGYRRLISRLNRWLAGMPCRSCLPWVRATLVGHWRRVPASTWCADSCAEFWPVVGTRVGTRVGPHCEETLIISSSQRWRARLNKRYLGHTADFPWWQDRMVVSTHRRRIRGDGSFTIHVGPWVVPHSDEVGLVRTGCRGVLYRCLGRLTGQMLASPCK
jgi:hypothetical protein